MKLLLCLLFTEVLFLFGSDSNSRQKGEKDCLAGEQISLIFAAPCFGSVFFAYFMKVFRRKRDNIPQIPCFIRFHFRVIRLEISHFAMSICLQVLDIHDNPAVFTIMSMVIASSALVNYVDEIPGNFVSLVVPFCYIRSSRMHCNEPFYMNPSEQKNKDVCLVWGS